MRGYSLISGLKASDYMPRVVYRRHLNSDNHFGRLLPLSASRERLRLER